MNMIGQRIADCKQVCEIGEIYHWWGEMMGRLDPQPQVAPRLLISDFGEMGRKLRVHPCHHKNLLTYV